MKKLFSKIILLTASLLLVLSPVAVFAAQFSVEASTVNLKPGDQIETYLTVNAQKESVNALSGVLNFDTKQLSVREIRTGRSIVSFWIEQPVETSAGIRFAGMIPGGYTQDGGSIFSVVFEVKSVSNGSVGIVSVEKPQILLNDGKGTAAAVTLNNYFYQINLDNSLPRRVDPINDAVPPESFTSVISKDENLFGGKWFLTFSTLDKISGVDHYEVKEGWLGRFHTVESPYQLQDQDLSSKITVRAVDKAGNVRVEVLAVRNKKLFYEKIAIYGIIILLLLTFVSFGMRKFRNKNS
jgi:hypothetical protein